jgi:hypothetical protein
VRAFNAAHHGSHALNVLDANAGAVIVAEIELGVVAVQVLLAAMLINTPSRRASGLCISAPDRRI